MRNLEVLKANVATLKADALRFIAEDGIEPPHTQGENWLKWTGGDWLVLLRANGAGWELDPHWIEPDGRPNRLFAPRRFTYWPHLSVALRALLADCSGDTARRI